MFLSMFGAIALIADTIHPDSLTTREYWLAAGSVGTAPAGLLYAFIMNE